MKEVSLEQVESLLCKQLPKFKSTRLKDSTPGGLLIDKEQLLSTAQILRDTSEFFFDFLASVTGIDQGTDQPIVVCYHLHSIVYAHSLCLQVEIDREDAEIPSLAEIWRGANWHEREAYDLLGIRFAEHPDLRRIFLPDQWKGHPLRKDYTTASDYGGIPIDYAQRSHQISDKEE